MKKLLPFSLILIAALILAACASARSEAPVPAMDFIEGGAAPVAPQEEMFAPEAESAHGIQ